MPLCAEIVKPADPLREPIIVPHTARVHIRLVDLLFSRPCAVQTPYTGLAIH